MFLDTFERRKSRYNTKMVIIWYVLITYSTVETIWIHSTKCKHPILLFLPTQLSDHRIYLILIISSIAREFLYNMDRESGSSTQSLAEMFSKDTARVYVLWMSNGTVVLSNTFSQQLRRLTDILQPTFTACKKVDYIRTLAIQRSFFIRQTDTQTENRTYRAALAAKKCPTKKRNAQTHTQTHRRKTGVIELLSQLKMV